MQSSVAAFEHVMQLSELAIRGIGKTHRRLVRRSLRVDGSLDATEELTDTSGSIFRPIGFPNFRHESAQPVTKKLIVIGGEQIHRALLRIARDDCISFLYPGCESSYSPRGRFLRVRRSQILL